VPHGTAPPAIIDAALDALARGVVDIRQAYNGIAYLDSWVDDPWVHGSYAGFAPGQYTDFWGSSRTPKGTRCSPGNTPRRTARGISTGGVETGERAARQVLNVLG
jgi:monoamine oxidase